MEFDKFIEFSFCAIQKSRESITGLAFNVNKQPVLNKLHNVYIELLAEIGNKIMKIEQWNFKCLKTLVESEYESNEDEELDSVEVHQKSFFEILDEKLSKFHPKLLIKTLEPSKLILKVVNEEQELRSFYDEDVYLINVGEYEGQAFSCRVTLQTLHTEMSRSEKKLAMIESSEDEFEVLEDISDDLMKKERQELVEKNSKIQTKKEQTNMINLNVEKLDKKEETPIRDPIACKEKELTAEYVDMSKYSTKEISVSEYEKKVFVAEETMEFIKKMKREGLTLGNFLQKLS